MVRLDGADRVPDEFRGAVIALGNFDGFHLGHQAVVGHAVRRARAAGSPAIVGTFDPHPMRYFRPDAPPFRLTTLDQRAMLFAGAGIDAMIVYRFDATLAKVDATAFVTDWLHDRAGASGIVTGEDFNFGQARSGTAATLRARGAPLGIVADAVPAITQHGLPVSSSRIRDALSAGDCATATTLLTRPFALRGQVEHGDKVGRTLGYPTANLALGDYLRPRYGIYAVRGRLPGGRVVGGVANLGIRPTFEPARELLEPYFFDFDGDLYGQTIEVELIAWLRGEAKFDTLDALTAQMAHDEAAARRVLAA